MRVVDKVYRDADCMEAQLIVKNRYLTRNNHPSHCKYCIVYFGNIQCFHYTYLYSVIIDKMYTNSLKLNIIFLHIMFVNQLRQNFGEMVLKLWQ